MANEEEKYVTKLELIKTQQNIENKVTSKIDEVDKKVDTLNDIVLPLVESSKQTAENTKHMATSLDSFTNEQRKTNGKFYDRLHEHDLSLTEHDSSLSELGKGTKAQIENKKANATIAVALIAALGSLITGLFNLAPIIFN